MEVTTHQLRANQTLEDKFKTLSEKLASSKENVTCFQVELTSVYIELTRKLCNTRIEEFLSSHHQMHAAKQGNATTSGQNLRDCLLSQHVNLKTLIKNIHNNNYQVCNNYDSSFLSFTYFFFSKGADGLLSGMSL